MVSVSCSSSKTTNGHCLVPRTFEMEGYKLGVWVGNQRLGKDHLSHDRQQRLNNIDFVFNPYETAWEKGFDSLVQFKEIEGHCKVKKRFKQNGFHLGQWVISQRVRKSYLPPERIQRLDDLGFIWDMQKDKT